MAPRAAWAISDPQFTVQVDRESIGLDDTVSLKFSLTTEGSVRATAPSFQAPDFDVVNSYDSSFVESYYDSTTNHFGMKNSQQLTKVLKPSRQGDLHISHIQIRVDGQLKTAPDVVIHVAASGAGTPPPRAYGGGGVGLRGAGKPTSGKVILRAEVDKDHAYKGEQVVVSYYLYRRVRMLNVQVDKFPQLPGFLREEMEMPVMQPRMDSESVVLDGAAYQRSLLARYAAYPLQEGKLSLDPMGVKYTYYSDPGVTDDGDDPIMSFFRTMAPKEAAVQSENISINVIPLPADGRPSSFSGGVGDFNVVSAIDKTTVRANEAVTLTVKVEGRGNVASIGEPKVKWPANVEVYDTKSSAKTGKAGVGEKIFEILLIPRSQGTVTLPGVEFSFFDPVKKQYVTRSTEPVQVTVTEGAAGSPAAAPAASSAGNNAPHLTPSSEATPNVPPGEMRGLRNSLSTLDNSSVLAGIPFWRIIYYLASLAIAIFALIIGRDLFRRIRDRGVLAQAAKARGRAKSWDRLKQLAREANSGASWQDVAQGYESLESVIFDTIDRLYSLGARSLARAELKRFLVEEKGLAVDRWTPIDQLLGFSEMVRFGGRASPGAETRARSELERWVKAAQSAIQALEELR